MFGVGGACCHGNIYTVRGQGEVFLVQVYQYVVVGHRGSKYVLKGERETTMTFAP